MMGRFASRAVGVLGGALILLALAAALARRPVAALAAFLLALGLRVASSAGRRRPGFAVSALGIAWTHPERGNGAMAWRQVGALVVREARGGRELALYLVPRPPEARADAETSPFVLSTADLGRGRVEGERRLAEFAATVLPRLSGDVAVDRETRRRLAAWGGSVTPG